MLTLEQRLLLWLSYGTDGDDTLFYDILSRFVDLEEAFEAAGNGQRQAFEPVPDRAYERLVQASEEGFLERYAGWLTKNGIRILTPYDDIYPVSLESEDDPPPVLFAIGTVPEGRCSAFTAENGRVTDSVPDGPVIAVLTAGIDRLKDALSEKELAEILKHGAVLTPFLPKTAESPDTVEKAFRIAKILSDGSSRHADDTQEQFEPEPEEQDERKKVPFSGLTDNEQQIYMAARISEPEVNMLPSVLGLTPEEIADAGNSLIRMGALRILDGKLVLDERRMQITFEG